MSGGKHTNHKGIGSSSASPSSSASMAWYLTTPTTNVGQIMHCGNTFTRTVYRVPEIFSTCRFVSSYIALVAHFDPKFSNKIIYSLQHSSIAWKNYFRWWVYPGFQLFQKIAVAAKRWSPNKNINRPMLKLWKKIPPHPSKSDFPWRRYVWHLIECPRPAKETPSQFSSSIDSIRVDWCPKLMHIFEMFERFSFLWTANFTKFPRLKRLNYSVVHSNLYWPWAIGNNRYRSNTQSLNELVVDKLLWKISNSLLFSIWTIWMTVESTVFSSIFKIIIDFTNTNHFTQNEIFWGCRRIWNYESIVYFFKPFHTIYLDR